MISFRESDGFMFGGRKWIASGVIFLILGDNDMGGVLLFGEGV